MWTLILTVLSFDGYAIASVPGFADQLRCTSAGKAWLAQTHESRVRYGGAYAMCVQIKS